MPAIPVGMADSDDDAPPLETMSEQLSALKLGYRQPAKRADDAAEILPVAQVAVAQYQAKVPNSHKQDPGSPALKKGFFDTKPKARRKPSPIPKESAGEEMPVLRARTGEKSIPDFLRLDPSEEQKKLNEVKDGLFKALKPTQETLASVMQDPVLLAGFDDPEVMAAVNEIAKDPGAMRKYAGNPKVRKFYEAMGTFVGNQLEKKGGSK